MPNARIELKRYSGHRREGFFYMLAANALLALSTAGVYVVLPNSTPLALRVALIGAAGALVVVAVIRHRRRRLDAVAASIEISPTLFVFTRGRGSPASAAVTSLVLRRLAYLRHEGGTVDHAPVLEVQVPRGPRLRIVGPGQRAWSQFDADLGPAPRYTAEAGDWDRLCELLGPGGKPR